LCLATVVGLVAGGATVVLGRGAVVGGAVVTGLGVGAAMLVATLVCCAGSVITAGLGTVGATTTEAEGVESDGAVGDPTASRAGKDSVTPSSVLSGVVAAVGPAARRPEYARSASTPKPPASTTPPAAVQAVSRRTVRSPASRATAL
jgi:hypothetical protein